MQKTAPYSSRMGIFKLELNRTKQSANNKQFVGHHKIGQNYFAQAAKIL